MRATELILLWTLAATSGVAGATSFGLVDLGSYYLNVPVESYKERPFRTTIRQQYDYSCGSAALATLLTYHYDRKVSEREVFDGMYALGDQQKIQREGFSLLDIKRYLGSIGYRANGYKAPLWQLLKVGVPAIVLIQENGYNHFVVVKGVTDSDVLVGDPSLGSRIIPGKRFEKLWTNGILFVIDDAKEEAAFNRTVEWRVREMAPLSAAVSRDGLANITILTRPENDL